MVVNAAPPALVVHSAPPALVLNTPPPALVLNTPPPALVLNTPPPPVVSAAPAPLVVKAAPAAALGERWNQLVTELSQTGALAAMVRELAWQAGLQQIDERQAPPTVALDG